MKKIALVLALALTACQPLWLTATPPAPIVTPTPSNRVTVTAVSDYRLRGVNVAAVDFCEKPLVPSRFGPFQPYNTVLGPGATDTQPAQVTISGDLSSCFLYGHPVTVIFNQNYILVACWLTITRGSRGYRFTPGAWPGTDSDCSLTVTSSYSATFTFNVSGPMVRSFQLSKLAVPKNRARIFRVLKL